MPSITTDGDRLRVHFDAFGLDAYALFLKCKKLPESTCIYHEDGETYTLEAPARFAPLLGVELPPAGAPDLPLSPFLFDDQRAIARMALGAKRFACWSDCGLGKTLIQLEWARHVIQRTAGRVLIITMNEILPQTIE